MSTELYSKGVAESRGGQSKADLRSDDTTDGDLTLGTQTESIQVALPEHCTGLVALEVTRAASPRHETLFSPLSVDTRYGLERLAAKCGGIAWRIDPADCHEKDIARGMYGARLLGQANDGEAPPVIGIWVLSITNDPHVALPQVIEDETTREKTLVTCRESDLAENPTTQGAAKTATASQAAEALCAYIRQTAPPTSRLHGCGASLMQEGPEWFLNHYSSYAAKASRWLVTMATTRWDQDYTFFGVLPPEEMRLELVLGITNQEAPRTIPDHEAVEVIQAAAHTLRDRVGGDPVS